MGWKEGFNKALLRFVQESIPDATEVTSFEEEKQERGYCDTCGYTVIVVMIYYRVPDSTSYKIMEWEGNFGELINKLTEEPDD